MFLGLKNLKFALLRVLRVWFTNLPLKRENRRLCAPWYNTWLYYDLVWNLKTKLSWEE